MTIRPSRAGDGAALFALWERAVDATHQFLSADDRAAIGEQVRPYVASAPLLLAVDANDRPLGFLGMAGTHVDALFVDPACHGRGIGRGLMARATENGARTVDVNEQNTAATAFYRRLGFREAGRSPTDDTGRPYPLLHLARDGDA